MQQKICAVPKCRNSATDKFLKFYALPYNDKEVCKEWIRRIGNPKLYIQHVNVGPPVYKICEIHFDYVCKTEVNSGLHEGSLPTLHLPTIKNVRPATNCFFNARRSPLSTKVVTETPKEKICLQVEMCSQICRICSRQGILYDIKNSVYNKETHLVAIIKSLIPEYVMNSSEVQESLCLNCIKELLTCYLTIIRIENAMKVFSFLLEPLKDKTIANRIVDFTQPTNLDMKTILFDCKLEISADSFKTYISHENIEGSIQKENLSLTESLDVPLPIIHEDVKIDVDIDLPTSTLTNNQLTEWTDTSDSKELLNDILSVSMDLSNMTNTSSQTSNNLIDTSSEMLNIRLTSSILFNCLSNNTNLNISVKDGNIINTDTTERNKTQFTEILLNTPQLACLLNGTQNLNQLTSMTEMLKNVVTMTGSQIKQEETEIQQKTPFRVFECGEVGCAFTCDTLGEHGRHAHAQGHSAPVLRRCPDCRALCRTGSGYYHHIKLHKKQLTPKEAKSHECEHCTKVFPKRYKLLQHLIKVHGKRVYCPTCKKLVKIHNLSNHMKRHENGVKCSECETPFSTKRLLHKHELEQHPKMCLICSKTFSSLFGVRLHIANHVRLAKKESFQCEFCSKIFNSKIGLLSHLRHREKVQTCSPSKQECLQAYSRLRIVCTICGKSVSRSRIAYHMRVAHSRTKRYECDRCSYRSHFKPNLFRHQLTHSGDKPYLCTECGYGCIQKAELDAHMISHLTSPQPIPCKYCDETFKTKYDSRIHAQKHGVLFPRGKLQSSEKKYTCLQCHRLYSSLVLLRSHIAVIHEKISEFFNCLYCNKPFRTYTALSFHIRRIHNAPKRPNPRVCKFCERVCATSTELSFHMRAHTGERPYQCTLCPARFKQPAHLRTHKAGIHDDRRPFPCTSCSKAFRSKTALNEHIRTHTGERLRCAHCDKMFAGNSNRCKHMREVHNIRTIPIYTKSSS